MLPAVYGSCLKLLVQASEIFFFFSFVLIAKDFCEKSPDSGSFTSYEYVLTHPPSLFPVAEPEGCGHLREVGVPLPQGDARSGQDPSGQGENVLYSTYLRGKTPVVRKKT